MNRLCFASDNASGAHPEVLAAITRANDGFAIAYGGDRYTESVVAKLKQAFESDPAVFFTFGGTGANVMGIGSVARSYEAVFCSDCSHIWSDECAAPQKFFGGKLVPVTTFAGKIDSAAVAAEFGPNRGVHHTKPKVLSITQPTELGTVYTLDEMRSIGEFCRENGLIFHVDGARLANAAVSLGCSLANISVEVGVDVLSFGGTKNGLIGAEAVLYFDQSLATDAGYARKQTTQLASKMRFLAAQFDALLSDNLWYRNASHANAMAARLENCLKDIPSISLSVPRQINALFPILPPKTIRGLQSECDFYMWNETASIARWMTSFSTTEDEVDRFSELIHRVT